MIKPMYVYDSTNYMLYCSERNRKKKEKAERKELKVFALDNRATCMPYVLYTA